MSVLRSLGTMLCFVTMVASSMMLSNAAYAGPASQPSRRASSKPLPPFAAFVAEASRRFSVPEQWIRAVMHIESDAKPRARSFRGAMGLMQIMPGTWNELRVRHRLGTDPYDPHDNILAGTAYLRELHDRYGTPGFLAAYNAGPGRYERHLATGRPLPEETRSYVAVLAPALDRAPTKGPPAAVGRSFAWASSPLFAVRSAGFVHDLRSPIDRPQTYSAHAHAVVDLSALVPQSGNLFVRLARPSRSP
jgi:soluble lytic murein transglycosylase-like protein